MFSTISYDKYTTIFQFFYVFSLFMMIWNDSIPYSFYKKNTIINQSRMYSVRIRNTIISPFMHSSQGHPYGALIFYLLISIEKMSFFFSYVYNSKVAILTLST